MTICRSILFQRVFSRETGGIVIAGLQLFQLRIEKTEVVEKPARPSPVLPARNNLIQPADHDQ